MVFSNALFKPISKIPTGLIIPYTDGGGGAPDGWSLYSAADGFNIVGAGSTYAVDANGVGSGNVIAVTDTTGGHYGSTRIQNVKDNGGRYRETEDIDDYAGDHFHTATVPYIPPRIGCYLIKAGEGQILFPTNSVVWTYGVDKSSVGGLSNIWTNDYMFYALAGYWSAGTNIYNGIITSYAGQHNHGKEDSGEDSGAEAEEAAGGHTHTIDVIMVNNLRQRAMAAWQNAAANIPLALYGPNIIGMYESLTPPLGWHLCNGSNGTPDMRDYFIKNTFQASAGVGSGDGTVTATTAGGLIHGSHDHDDTGAGGTGSRNAYHKDNVQMDPHGALNSNHLWLPPYYALAFIMKG